MSSLQLRIALVTLGLGSCQSDPLVVGSGADTVTTTSPSMEKAEAGASASSPSASSCSDLSAGGPTVDLVFEAGPPPDLGQGGPIVDGTYDLTGTTIYRSAPTTEHFTDRETIRISSAGTRLAYVTASDGLTIVESLAPVGASLNPTTKCPGPEVSVGPYYTATPDTFTIVNALYVKVFRRTAP